MHLQDIPPALVPQLAKILQFRPLEDARKKIPTLIRSLPSTYRPGRLEKIFLPPPSGHLCRLHKGLDPEVVVVLFRRLQHEVGPRLNNPTSKCELLSPDQRKRLVRLRGLHALWLSPREYEVTFLASLQDSKWKHQECEACTISHISGDMETLLDLRWTIRSRATSRHVAKHGNPRLQIWVEAWIALLAEHTSKHTSETVDLDTVYLKNEAEAVLFKRARAKIHDIRVNKLKMKKVGDLALVAHSAGTASTGDVSPVEVSDDDDDSDALDTYLTTKGHSPYSYAVRKSTQESLYSVDTLGNGNNARTAAATSGLDRVPEEHQEYIPPRQEWRAAAQESRIYFKPIWESKNGGGSRTSWETERFDMQTIHDVQPGRASRRDPADTYLNLVDPFPADSSASIKAPVGSSVTDRTRRENERGAVGASEDMSTDAAGTHRGGIDSQSKSSKVGKGNTSAAVFVVDNASQSSWGGLYESQVRLRTDLDWFYGQRK